MGVKISKNGHFIIKYYPSDPLNESDVFGGTDHDASFGWFMNDTPIDESQSSTTQDTADDDHPQPPPSMYNT